MTRRLVASILTWDVFDLECLIVCASAYLGIRPMTDSYYYDHVLLYIVTWDDQCRSDKNARGC